MAQSPQTQAKIVGNSRKQRFTSCPLTCAIVPYAPLKSQLSRTNKLLLIGWSLFRRCLEKCLLFGWWLLIRWMMSCLKKILENLHYAIKLDKVGGIFLDITNPVAKFLLLEIMNYIRFAVDSFFGFLFIETVFEKV